MVLFDGIEDIFQKWREHSECSRDLVSLFTSIGLITLLFIFLRASYSSIQGLRLYVFSQSSCCKTDYIKKYGKWAVVTGSTDGIGLAMAHELARRGHSIIVMGRNAEKLANTKASLDTEPNVGEVLTVHSDLSDPSPENFERVRAEIVPDIREIGILINNAGVFPEQLKPLQLYDMNSLSGATVLNCLAPVYMAHMILPGMAKRRKGLIVNVSSIFGHSKAGYLGVYSATKAFITSFSKQLQTEYGPLGVDVINLLAGPVSTKQFTAVNQTNGVISSIVPSSDYYARSVINAVSTRITSFCGCAFHELVLFGSNCVDCLGLHAIVLRSSLMAQAKSFTPKP